MRLDLNEIERLPPAPFILFVGATGGVLQALPSIWGRDHIAIGLVTQVGVQGAALLLWWVAVRRRRFSVWRTALHLMLALDLAHVIGLLLSLSSVGMQFKASWATPLLSAVLGMSPFRFLGALALVAMGRLLPGSGKLALQGPFAHDVPEIDA
jgi:hypothetical protein